MILRTFWMLALASLGLLAACTQLGAMPEPSNVLVIMVDDLDTASFDQLLAAGLLPNIDRQLLQRGMRFNDSIVTNSACCPSRASFLTGQYAHNHGVNSIGGDHGGVPGFHPDGDMNRPTLATWLKSADVDTSSTYYTGLIGKYMNHYAANENGTFPIPAGWDVWRALNNTGTHQLEPGAYQIVDNAGNASAPPFYQTRFIGDAARAFLGAEDADGMPSWPQADSEPFFLYLNPTAPHVISLPEDVTHYASCDRTHPQWLERVVPDSAETKGYQPHDYLFPDAPSCDLQFPAGCLRQDGADGVTPLAGFDLPGVERLGSTAAFLDTYDQGPIGQADEALRPAWIDFHWDPLTCADNLDLLRRQHLDRLESMLSVDVMVGEVIAALEDRGALDDTLIIFTSDNGFMLGEHRLGNKQVAYEEAISVPLIIRPPGSQIMEGAVSEALVANIDLAPTILDYAARPWQSYPVDGRSLRPLIEASQRRGPAAWLGTLFGGAPAWRDQILVEHWHPDGQEDFLTHPDRWWRVPTHLSLRTANNAQSGAGLTLVEYADEAWGQNDPAWLEYYGSGGYFGEFLYDLRADRSQVTNFISASAYADVASQLREALQTLSVCAADSCRQGDGE